MRGEQAALIVQAEDHVRKAVQELYIAHARCERLQLVTTDEVVKVGMQAIMDKLLFHIGAIQDAEYEEDFRQYWSS